MFIINWLKSLKKSPYKGKPHTLDDNAKKIELIPERPKTNLDTVTIRFEFRINNKRQRVEKEFSLNQKPSELYRYLREDFFESVDDLMIIQLFPKTVIPDDDKKSLRYYNMQGNVVLSLVFSGNPNIKTHS